MAGYELRSGINGLAKTFLLAACLCAACLFGVSGAQESGRDSGSAPGKSRGPVITIANMGGDFTLTGHTGKSVSLNDFKGKVVVLMFGYTFCPDVCPTGLSLLNQALNEIGKRASEVQVLFITVDPERDTPERLKEYVAFFNPSFIGLSGTHEQIRKVANQYAVSYFLGKPDEKGDYAVSHSSFSYIINKQGKMAKMVPFNLPPDLVSKMIKELL